MFYLLAQSKDCSLQDPIEDCTNLLVDSDEISRFKNYPKLSSLSITANPVPCFEGWVYITKVTLQSGVTQIPDRSFAKMINLVQVELPDTLETIGNNTFEWCKSLTSLTIPSSVTTIGTDIVKNCYSLTSINSEGVYKSINGALFTQDNELVAFPLGLTGSFEFPEGCLTVGDSQLSESKISSITFHGQTIQNNAFSECPNLNTVIIPSTIFIGENAFYHCKSLTTIDLSSVTNISKKAFAYTSIESVSLGNLLSFESFAFAYCRSLKSLSIQSATVIPERAFYFCISLESVIIPDSVTSIESDAFNHCHHLKDLTLSSSLSYLGSDAFAYCYLLKSVHFPKHLTSIEGFSYSGIQKVTYDEDIQVDSISLEGFNDLSEFTFPASYTDIDSSDLEMMTEDLYYFNGYNFSEGNPNYTTIDGVLYSKDKTKLIKFPSRPFFSKFTVPSSVTTICTMAFQGANNNIDSLEFTSDSKLTTIETNAFGNLYRVTKLVLPKGVTVIPDLAFQDMTSLREIEFKGQITSIGEYAFSNTAIRSITLPSTLATLGEGAFQYSAVSEVKFAKGIALTVIPKWCFQYTPLESIILPEGIVEIQESAFEGTHLKSFSFPSSLAIVGTYIFRDTWMTTVVAYNNLIPYGMYSDCKYLKTADLSSVTSIGPRAFQGSSLEEVKLSNNLTLIQYEAFSGCSNLSSIIGLENTQVSEIIENGFEGTAIESVTIPTSATTIKTSAFANCVKLATVVMHDKLETVEYNAFGGCTSLKKLEVKAGLVNGIANLLHNDLEEITISGNPLFTIYNNNIYDSNNLFIGIPPAMKNAVIAHENLTEVELGCSSIYTLADTIELDVFLNGECTITAPNARTLAASSGIDQLVFACDSLEKATLPAATIVAKNAFNGCPNLKEIEIPNLAEIGDGALSGTSISSFAIPSNFTNSMSPSVFKGCAQLAEITVGEGNERFSVVDGALVDNHTVIVYPAARTGTFTGLEEMDYYADVFVGTPVTELTLFGEINGQIKDMPNLVKVTLSNVTLLPDDAFDNCPNLAEIDGDCVENGVLIFNDKVIRVPQKGANTALTIGNVSVTESALSGCQSIETITFENNSLLESLTLHDLPNLKAIINIPFNVSSLDFSELPKLAEVSFDNTNEHFVVLDGVIYTASLDELVYYPNSLTKASFTVPCFVSSVADDVFSFTNNLVIDFEENSHVENMQLPVGAKEVHFSSRLMKFSHSEKSGPLSVIDFEDGSVMWDLSSLGQGLDIEKLTIPPCVVEIPFSFGEGCTIKDVTMGEIEVIRPNAFAGTMISSFTLPPTVVAVGFGSFANCSVGDFGITEESVLRDLLVYENGKDLKLVITKRCYIKDAFNFGIASIAEIDVSPENPVISYDGMRLLNNEARRLIWAKPDDSKINIDEEIIDEKALAFYKGEIEINYKHLRIVNEHAFADSSIQEFSICSNLELVETNAFDGTNLTTLYIYDQSNCLVTQAFYPVTTITTIYTTDPEKFDKSHFANAENIEVLLLIQDSKDEDSNIGLILGITIPSIVVVAGAIVFIVYYMKKRNYGNLSSVALLPDQP